MSRVKSVRIGLILTIMCVMCWMTLPVLGASPDDEKLQELEQEVDALKAAIEELRPADEPALLAGLVLADNDLTWWSLYALSRCGTAAGVPALVARLQDDDAAIRSAAALALAHIQRRDSSIVPFVAAPICALLTDEGG